MQNVVSMTTNQTLVSSTNIWDKEHISLTHNREINMYSDTPESMLLNDDNNTHGPINITNVMSHASTNLRTNDNSGAPNHPTLPVKYIQDDMKKGVNSESNTGGCCGCKAR